MVWIIILGTDKDDISRMIYQHMMEEKESGYKNVYHIGSVLMVIFRHQEVTESFIMSTIIDREEARVLRFCKVCGTV